MKNRKIALLFSLILLILMAMLTGSCSVQTENPVGVVTNVNAQESFDLIQENVNNPDFIIIDVRTPEEYNDGHIENAINIDYRSSSFESDISKLDRDKVCLVYCRSGNRSSDAVEIMRKLGFQEIYHLDVGITGWKEDGFTVIK